MNLSFFIVLDSSKDFCQFAETFSQHKVALFADLPGQVYKDNTNYLLFVN